MQTEETTVLNVLGLLKISHVGVRMHDAMVCWVPAPKEEERSALEIARDGLDNLVAAQKKTTPPTPSSKFRGALDELDKTLAFLQERPASPSGERLSSEPSSQTPTRSSPTDDEDVVFETPTGSSASPSESSIEESPPPSPYRERGYQRVRDRPWFGNTTSPMIFPDTQSEE
jgi:hypothetical protein